MPPLTAMPVFAYRTSAWLRSEPPAPAWSTIPVHWPAAVSLDDVKRTGCSAVPLTSSVPLEVREPVSLIVAPGSAVTVTPSEIVVEVPVYGLPAGVSVMFLLIVVGRVVAEAAGTIARAGRSAVAIAQTRASSQGWTGDKGKAFPPHFGTNRVSKRNDNRLQRGTAQLASQMAESHQNRSHYNARRVNADLATNRPARAGDTCPASFIGGPQPVRRVD